MHAAPVDVAFAPATFASVADIYSYSFARQWCAFRPSTPVRDSLPQLRTERMKRRLIPVQVQRVSKYLPWQAIKPLWATPPERHCQAAILSLIDFAVQPGMIGKLNNN